MNKEFIKQITEALGEDQVQMDVQMAKHTTFRIGGPAKYFLTPHTIEGVKMAVCICKEMDIPYYILGNGSNLLVSDSGYSGAIIQLYKNFSQVVIENETIVRVQAGALLSAIAKTAYHYGLSGMETLSGIPGTVGGAVVMNAGAYGGEIRDVLVEVTVLDAEGQIQVIPADQLELGYRTSLIAKRGDIVLEAVLSLERGEKEKIGVRMEELREQRVIKQPLSYPSAGSTFKRPEGYFAGKLIQDAGLSGYQVGGAKVSEKHCGFVVNVGNATAYDVFRLIQDVKNKVWEKDHILLEPEIKMLGMFRGMR